MLSQNDFPEPNQHILTLIHPILLCAITYGAPQEMPDMRIERFAK
jgi:hypothetical protein